MLGDSIVSGTSTLSAEQKEKILIKLKVASITNVFKFSFFGKFY